MKHTAILSNSANYTIFRFGSRRLKFRAPQSLERYVHINEWDHGYIAVMAKYSHQPELVEEYIDLTAILNDLKLNANEFLAPIQNVVIDDE